MKNIDLYINPLRKLLNTTGISERLTQIALLEERVENNDFSENEIIDLILTELVYNLNFYEPRTELRKDIDAFFGEEGFCNYVNDSIKKIHDYYYDGKMPVLNNWSRIDKEPENETIFLPDNSDANKPKPEEN